MKKDKSIDEYEEESCEFLNEAECEERLEERGITLEEAARKHFGEDDEEDYP